MLQSFFKDTKYFHNITSTLYSDLVLDDDQIKSYGLAEIEALLQAHDKTMKEDYPTMPWSDLSFNNEGRNRLIYDELRYDRNILKDEHQRLMSTMTSEQKTIYDKIMARVISNQPGFFFLYGYGGIGTIDVWLQICYYVLVTNDI